MTRARRLEVVADAPAEDVPATAYALPTRRERLASAAEALAFLRGLVRDDRAEPALRVRVAMFMLEQAKREAGWVLMPNERHTGPYAPSAPAFLKSDDPNEPDE